MGERLGSALALVWLAGLGDGGVFGCGSRGARGHRCVWHSRGLWPPQSGPGRRNRWTGGPVHIGKGLQVYLSFQCQRMGMYGK